jgi:integrase
MARDWRGGVVAHGGRLYLRVRDSTGEWVDRAPYPDRALLDTPDGRATAERVLVEVVRELHARERATEGRPGPLTVDAWSRTWLAERRASGLADAENDEARLRLHVLPTLGAMRLEEVEPHHLKALATAWTAAGKAPRTRRNIYSVVKAMFRDARIDGALRSPDPCILTHRQLGKIRDARGGWRAGAVFTRDELAALLSDERIPPDRQVWYGLLGPGMLRTGEAAGLRWRAVHLDVDPLGRLDVLTSYDDGSTKTETDRWMPVHPALAELLAAWRLGGWARTWGRQPEPDDLVCPTPAEPRRPGRVVRVGSMRDRHWAWKRLRTDLVTLGLRHRRAHDLRRTGISLARSDGASRDVLGWGTHAPPRDVLGLYTSLEWEALCREVAKMQLELQRGGVVVPLGAST